MHWLGHDFSLHVHPFHLGSALVLSCPTPHLTPNGGAHLALRELLGHVAPLGSVEASILRQAPDGCGRLAVDRGGLGLQVKSKANYSI